MSISQRLDLRQSTSLVMTPQLQQAIKLLQMSNLELGDYVTQEIESNPLLERGESNAGETLSSLADQAHAGIERAGPGDGVSSQDPNASDYATDYMGAESTEFSGISDYENPSSDVAADLSGVQSEFSPLLPKEQENFSSDDGGFTGSDQFNSPGLDEAEFGASQQGKTDFDYGDSSAYLKTGTNNGGDSEFDPVQNVAVGTSLREHLLSQIHVDFNKPQERMIAVAMLEMLDDSGYLPPDLQLAGAQMGAPPQLLEAVIQKLQRLEPAGIFARNLRECLEIQLREKDRLDPAMQTLLQHLDLVAGREKKALMRICAVDEEDLTDMLRELRNLNPKPATAFVADVAPPVTPDVLLRAKPGGGWLLELNAENLPKVLVNEKYYSEIQAVTLSKPDKEYLSDKWQQANWLKKALHQRATTILKVATEIVRRQDDFFVHGVQYLKPLILRDIAEAVEMHESTISRVTQNKYIATPRGIFELRYFFSASLATTGGEVSVSSIAVQDRIKALILSEQKNAILSDDNIAELLRTEGIDIARRTVAKYREGLGIPTSAQRKRNKRLAF